MSVSKEEAQALVDEVLSACPALSAAGREKARQLVGLVITETTSTIRGIEKRIEEAGTIPPEITMTLMHYGALLGIVKDLPPGNERRALVEAGERVGAFIARKYGEKIKETLVDKTTKH